MKRFLGKQNCLRLKGFILKLAILGNGFDLSEVSLHWPKIIKFMRLTQITSTICWLQGDKQHYQTGWNTHCSRTDIPPQSHLQRKTMHRSAFREWNWRGEKGRLPLMREICNCQMQSFQPKYILEVKVLVTQLCLTFWPHGLQ